MTQYEEDEHLELVNRKTGEMVERKIALSQESVDLLQKTICKDHTPDEVMLFVQYCQAKNLDPFGREVYSVKRGGKLTFQMGIDGLRGKAEETSEYNGQETAWCDTDGKWVDVWTSTMPPFAARVAVYRKGVDKAFVGIALWTEYKPADNDFIWKKMPSNQLAKCAEAIALRKAFPRNLGGLYASEEMEQASGGGSSKPKVAMPKSKSSPASPSMVTMAVDIGGMEETLSTEVFSEPPVGVDSDTKDLFPEQSPEMKKRQEEVVAAMHAQAPMSHEEVEKKMAQPKSKFFTKLHAEARKAKISDESMKAFIKFQFNKDSSKDLTDAECVQTITMIQKGIIKP